MSTWDAVLTSAPINNTAARVVSRRRGLEEPTTLTRQELLELVKRLDRKIHLLKLVLRITTKAQQKNLVYRLGKGRSAGERFKKDPRSAVELKRAGEEKLRLITRIAELKAEEKAANALVHIQWTPEEKAAHRLKRAEAS